MSLRKSKDGTSLPPRTNSRAEDNVPSCYTDTLGIITTTTNDVPGYKIIKMLGTIYGLTVRSRNWGADIGSFFKSSVGGELPMFTKLMYSARNEAMDRMVGECMSRGGNAIIGVRMDIAAESVWSQICAYGTACIIEKIEEGEGEEEAAQGETKRP